MVNYGVKVSKAGIDVTTANPEDLYLSSKYFNFKELANSGSAFKTGDNTALNGAINDVVTTITVDSTTNYSNTGVFYVDGGGIGNYEAIKYTGKTPTTFTGCTRGYWGTVASPWADNDVVTPGYTLRTVYTYSLNYYPVAFCWALDSVTGNLFALPYIGATFSFNYFITSTEINAYLSRSAITVPPSGGETWTIKYHCMYDKIKN